MRNADELATTARTMSIQQSKGYELDWSKVKTVEDVVLLIKLMHGVVDKPVSLYLYDDMVDDYKHLFKETDGHVE